MYTVPEASCQKPEPDEAVEMSLDNWEVAEDAEESGDEMHGCLLGFEQ